MSDAANSLIAALLDNTKQIELIQDFDSQLRQEGEPYGSPYRADLRKRLDFYIDRQADLDKVFSLMQFEVV